MPLPRINWPVVTHRRSFKFFAEPKLQLYLQNLYVECISYTRKGNTYEEHTYGEYTYTRRGHIHGLGRTHSEDIHTGNIHTRNIYTEEHTLRGTYTHSGTCTRSGHTNGSDMHTMERRDIHMEGHAHGGDRQTHDIQSLQIKVKSCRPDESAQVR